MSIEIMKRKLFYGCFTLGIIGFFLGMSAFSLKRIVPFVNFFLRRLGIN